MKIKDLQKITALYEQIKSIDAEIIKIEKMGMSIASNPTTISFCLKVVDENTKKEKSKANLFDKDGSLIRPDNACLPPSFHWIVEQCLQFFFDGDIATAHKQ